MTTQHPMDIARTYLAMATDFLGLTNKQLVRPGMSDRQLRAVKAGERDSAGFDATVETLRKLPLEHQARIAEKLFPGITAKAKAPKLTLDLDHDGDADGDDQLLACSDAINNNNRLMRLTLLKAPSEERHREVAYLAAVIAQNAATVEEIDASLLVKGQRHKCRAPRPRLALAHG